MGSVESCTAGSQRKRVSVDTTYIQAKQKIHKDSHYVMLTHLLTLFEQSLPDPDGTNRRSEVERLPSSVGRMAKCRTFLRMRSTHFWVGILGQAWRSAQSFAWFQRYINTVISLLPSFLFNPFCFLFHHSVRFLSLLLSLLQVCGVCVIIDCPRVIRSYGILTLTLRSNVEQAAGTQNNGFTRTR